MSARKAAVARKPAGKGLAELVRSVPDLLENLRHSYGELEERARRVENELSRTNDELAQKVEELASLKRHLEAVLDSLPCGVVVRDAVGKVARVNAAAASILGVSPGELLGRTDHEALRGRPSDGGTMESVRADGARLVVASSTSVVRIEDGSPNGSVQILDDYTERTALAERLHAADKMAALGTMAAGIAHEIRNPLNAVQGFAALLRKDVADPEKRLRWSQRIVEGAAEANAIIDSMLTFGSPDRLRSEAVVPEELFETALRLARSSTGDPDGPDAAGSRPVEVRSACDAPAFLGDALKLRHAVANLVSNSLQALRAAGAGERVVELAATSEEQEIVLAVRDSGPGIPPDLRARVLDPFFTTRPDGTGLGLALVSAIARLHDGRVLVRSASPSLGGAEIQIRFPFRPAPRPAPPTPRTAHP